ncbi:MAG: hypothetical protein HYV97_15520 [Bdellovibrio sp.]|nr:hypothetical protein [Bdellovibrio sp.]
MKLKSGNKLLSDLFRVTVALTFIALIGGCNIQNQDIEQLEKTEAKTKTQVVTNEVTLPTPLTVVPAFKQIFTNTEFVFTAIGGTPPYQFSLVSGPGTQEAGGKYLSPGAPGNTVIRVTDLFGSTADALITIDEELVITPNTKKLNVSTSFTFNVTGGNPPYLFAIASGGGSIDSNGVYTAPAAPTQTIIRVTDNRGTIVNAAVDVGLGPVISPTTKKMAVNTSFQFSVVGGTAPLTYAVALGSGAIDGTGNFTAPATPGNSTVRVTDALGYSSEATVESFIWNQISATYMSTCILKGNSGEVKCFGSNQYGELGRDGMATGDQPSDMGDNLLPTILATDQIPSKLAMSYIGVCALFESNLAQCWGYSGQGQNGFGGIGDTIGANSMGDNIPFVPIGANRTIVQMEGGYYQNCALLDNGDVKCWGYGYYGQLGQDNQANYYGASLYSLPAVNLGRPATKVSMGIWHACALLDNGTVKCWGYNGNGELGQDSTTWIGTGAGQMAALAPVNLGVGRTATDIGGGGYHTCVVLDNGNAKCWGYNAQGQLGIGSTDSRGDAPGEMAALPEISFAGRTFVKIAGGYYHTCAILDNNAMRCWGYNNKGQLGQGDIVSRGTAPGQMGTLVNIPLGTGRTVKQMAPHGEHTCAILDDDTLKCWGYNNYGQLGLGHLTNIGTDPSHLGDNLLAVNLGTNAIAKEIVRSISYDNTCAIIEKDGAKQVSCWGRSFYGEDGTMRGSVGIRTADMGSNLVAVNLGSMNGESKTITRSYLGHCATSTSGTGSGTSKCWGYNETSYRLLGSNSSEWSIGDTYGEIGSGIPNLNAGIGVKTIQVEGNDQSPFTCGLFDDTSLRCWGYNPYGNLGQDDTANRTYIPTTPPINLGAGRTATQFSLGPYSVCARLDNGTVKCWGYNPYGNLGQGHTNILGNEAGEMAALAPIDLGTGVTAKYVCTNNYHACALMNGANDGKIKCWGYAGNGQLGYEDTNNRGDVPGEMGDALPYVNLGTGRTVKKLSCGVNYTCAILDNDKLKCWGYNGYGQLGLNTTAQKGSVGSTMGDLLPYVDVGTGRTVVDIKASYYHTCALLDTNEVKCWGWNFRGQLGQGRADTYFGEAPNEMGDNLFPINF